MVVSANIGCTKDVAVLKEDWLIHQILNIHHSCLHLPESEKEGHKFKLGNFDYKRVDKFCYLGDMLSVVVACRSNLKNLNYNRLEEI